MDLSVLLSSSPWPIEECADAHNGGPVWPPGKWRQYGRLAPFRLCDKMLKLAVCEWFGARKSPRW